MRDVLFLLLTGGFFVVAVAYVRGCAAIVGPEVTAEPAPGEPDAGATEVTA
ncbi:MAG TPA: hypothetical protein VFI47_07745 [Acidimicrobiales bacterium]|nr:hypothetical protein [Acidimicrobiales bacterium]